MKCRRRAKPRRASDAGELAQQLEVLLGDFGGPLRETQLRPGPLRRGADAAAAVDEADLKKLIARFAKTLG